MDLNKIVTEEMKKLAGSGKIEEIVSKRLEDTVRNLVDQSLSTYSDFGKALKEKVYMALDLSTMKLDLPSYGQLMCNQVERIVKESMLGEAVAKIEENLKKIFQPLEKTQWKLSEIIEKFIEEIVNTDDGECGDITLHVHKSDSSSTDDYWDVYFDENADVEKYRCAYSLRINRNGVWDAIIDGAGAKTMSKKASYGFDAFIFQLFAMSCQIENDYEDIDTHYGRD